MVPELHLTLEHGLRREILLFNQNICHSITGNISNNQDDFRSWAKNIGTKTQVVVEFFLTSGSEPEQGYKSCSCLTKLSDRYGHERLEGTCERVLLYTSEPNIRNISTILKNGQDKIPSSSSEPDLSMSNSGGISRGPAYYKRGSAR